MFFRKSVTTASIEDSLGSKFAGGAASILATTASETWTVGIGTGGVAAKSDDGVGAGGRSVRSGVAGGSVRAACSETGDGCRGSCSGRLVEFTMSSEIAI